MKYHKDFNNLSNHDSCEIAKIIAVMSNEFLGWIEEKISTNNDA